jgi:hypothetical protein
MMLLLNNGSIVLPSLLLGLGTSFVGYLLKLNRRESRGDYRHWVGGKGLIRILFADLSLDKSIGVELASFSYFWILTYFYSCIWLVVLRYFNEDVLGILPLMTGTFALVTGRIAVEVLTKVLRAEPMR